MKLNVQFASMLMVMSLSLCLMDVPAVQSQDPVFDDQEVKGKAMVNHVIKEILTNTDASCRIKCHLIRKCVSYNLGPSTTPGMMVCQLNDADRHQYPQDYQDRPGYSYRGIKKPCVSSQCVGNAKSELTGSAAKTQEECVCFSGYTGKHCEEVQNADLPPDHPSKPCSPQPAIPLEHKNREWIKVNQEPVCVGVKDNAFGTLEIPFDCKNKQLKLVHVSGKVTPNGNLDSASNWGYTRTPDDLCIFITDINNKLMLPSSGYPKLNSAKGYFTISDIKTTSPELIYPEPFVSSSKGDQIRIWFGEDLYDLKEADNYGRTCADVYVRDY